MRYKTQILRSYLELINEEKGLKYSEDDINNKMLDTIEVQTLTGLLDDELYQTEEIGTQLVSTERAFFIFCNVVIHHDLKTGRRIWNTFVQKQFNLVERNRYACYMAHRGSGKTFFMSLYIIFKMYLLEFLDVCYCSNVPKQKKRFLKGTESIIDNNEMLLEKKDTKRVSGREVSWGQDDMGYNNGELEGTTVGTTPRGGHYNLVIMDDPLRDDKKYTDEFIVDYAQATLKPTTYTKKARYVIVGTPQHQEDLFHTLMNDKLDKNNRPIGTMKVGKVSAAGFFTQVYPAVLNEKTREILVPEIWEHADLMEEMKRIGDIRFNREMMCRCITHKNSLVSASLFRSCCDGELQMTQKAVKEEPQTKFVICVDSATSDAPTADNLAITVWEDDQKRDKFIFRHLFHEKGYPITDPTGGVDDQTNKVVRLHKDYNNALVVIEKNNAGIALIQAVQAKGIEVIEHYTHTPAGGQVTQKRGRADDVIDYVEHGLKAGVVVFPADPEDIFTIDALESVKNEHLNFGIKRTKTGEKYEAIAGHDDIFMSCMIAFKHRGDCVDTLPFAITMPGI
ncbi:MAG: hypothetical protein GY861_17480 [bacterium]|nr:hypothetical protein [bacterium]